MIGQRQEARNEESDLALLRDVAIGVVSLTESRLPADSLVLPLGLSLWMKQHDATSSDVAAAIVSLRSAVIEAAGLDVATEPVPLPVADPRVMLLNLAAYLADLVTRGARKTGSQRLQVTERALARMAV